MKSLQLSLLFFLTLLAFQAPVTAVDAKDYSKTIEKEFDITADGNTRIHNRHGKVDIKTWSENKVKITVLISVEARTDEDAQKVFDRVSIDFENDATHVSAETDFDNLLQRYWGRKFRDLKVDYEVYLPATNNIRIEQSHGKVYMEKIAGNASLKLSHADLEAGDIGGEADINISHGRGNIEKAGYINSRLSHAKLFAGTIADVAFSGSHATFEAESAQKVESSTSHSKLLLGKVQNLTTSKSSHDHFDIGDAGEVRIRASHSVMRIKQVTESLEANLHHGSCRSGVADRFASIHLEGSHANFEMKVKEGSHFRMDASSQHGGIHYPEDMQIHYHSKKNSSKVVKGYYGNEQAESLLRAKLSHGSLKVYKL